MRPDASAGAPRLRRVAMNIQANTIGDGMTPEELTGLFDRAWKAHNYCPPSDSVSMFAEWLCENWGFFSPTDRLLLVTVGESLYGASKKPQGS